MCSIHAEFYLRNLSTQVRDLLVEASRATEPRQHFLLMRLAPWHCLRGAASGMGCGGPVDYHSLTRLHRGAPALTCSARSSLSRGTFTLSAAGTQYVSLVSDALGRIGQRDMADPATPAAASSFAIRVSPLLPVLVAPAYDLRPSRCSGRSRVAEASRSSSRDAASPRR